MTPVLSASRVVVVLLGSACLACAQPSRPSAGEVTAGIDSLNARLVRAYRSHDPQAYAALYTDTAVFEWPAFNTVRGPAQLAAMARSEEHTSELQSQSNLVCRLLLEKKKKKKKQKYVCNKKVTSK